MIIDGYSLTPAAVAAVARSLERIDLDAAARGRVERDRAVVEDAVARQLPVYGVTTGLGARANFALPAAELAGFSVRTVRGRANAVGAPLPRDVVRAAVLVRCNGIAHGGSGIQPAVLDLLVAMLTVGVHPIVPEIGSIGASDLGQMAHIALVAIGEGRAEYQGELLPAEVALRRAGLKSVTLGPKDGLALCNSSALSAGLAALAYDDARKLLAAAQLVTTLSFEGLRANATPLDPRVQAARPLVGAQTCATQLRQLLAGGQLLDAGAGRRLQDPLSFRCAAHVHGAFHSAMGLLAASLDAELNGAGDNPLVLGEDREILSTGNFNTAALALALDTVALALFQTASICAQRTQRLLASSLTGLPENLSPHGSEHSGYAPLIKTVQALAAEMRHLSSPFSTDPRPGAALVEDDASNAPASAGRIGSMLDRLRYLLGIETLLAAQAVDLAAPGRIGRGPAALHRAVRERITPLDEDRASTDDVERIATDLFGPAVIETLLDQSGIGGNWSLGGRDGW
ncbi:MAG TPA: histidine ammonia-lyase [Solirubrobacteraceae bacterium]|nr:histidine ammonia-lyase [Solirubrobacteraceae bacterium]